jgi:DNA-directed RNA polymerase subunit N (RpoN/RPB10)
MSKPFPLQSVLEHRKRIEEQKQASRALAEAGLERARTAEALAQSQRHAVLAELQALKQAQKVDAQAIIAQHQQLLRTETLVSQAIIRRQQAEAAMAAAQVASITASQGRMAIERLHDQFRSRMLSEANNRENNTLSELGLIRWHQRAAE